MKGGVGSGSEVKQMNTHPAREMDLQWVDGGVRGDNGDSGPGVVGLLDRLACCLAG